jgi:Zn finger protein HypA/HybF involved in hydrogenase expression
MSEVHSRQKMQEEMQKNEEAISLAFGKLISGKAGYKAVIEKKPLVIKCRHCNSVLDISQKFCHECGAKVEHLQNK